MTSQSFEAYLKQYLTTEQFSQLKQMSLDDVEPNEGSRSSEIILPPLHVVKVQPLKTSI